MPPDISQLEGPAFRKLPDYRDQVEGGLEINEINTGNEDEPLEKKTKQVDILLVFCLKAGLSHQRLPI